MSRVNGPTVPLRPRLGVRDDDVAKGAALEREDRLFLIAFLWLLKCLIQELICRVKKIKVSTKRLISLPSE